MNIDWDIKKALLKEVARRAVRRFLGKHPGDGLAAIGFVFEFWNVSSQFDLCAELRSTRANQEPLDGDDRWNSGNYEYPAGLTATAAELGSDWEAVSDELHELAGDEPDSREAKSVYEGLIAICCDVLTDLALEGLFGDPAVVDFNVSEVNDAVSKVKARDQEIRRRIAESQAGK
jgi:hypothetical protein